MDTIYFSILYPRRQSLLQKHKRMLSVSALQIYNGEYPDYAKENLDMKIHVLSRFMLLTI